MSARYVRSDPPGFRSQDLGDEYLFHEEALDRVHILNATARRILLLCDGTRSVEEVAAVIAREHSVDPDTALADACSAIERLTSLGLLSPN